MVITIKDVARKAGVAHTTVSRALHGSPLISTETTERIRKLAVEMGYQPSAAARSLKTNRSQVLGVIVSAIDDPFFSEILQGIDDVAQASGYSLFIAAAQRDLMRERAIVRTMREHRVDGVIICSTPFSAEQSEQLRSYNIPIVVINNQSAEDYRYSIHHDDLDGSQQVMRHLIDLGHRQIAYLGYARSGRTNLKRLAGYRGQMKKAGLTIHAGYEFESQTIDPQGGQESVQHFLSLTQRPTAIFCYNDMLAIGVLRGLQASGLRVPEDCSIVGFDNIIFSAFTTPPLTTFDQPKRTIGVQAAQLILGLVDLNGAEKALDSKILTLKGSLLLRASTAAPVA
ncbi:MAG: LacI family DNA-binding transcriptional regulator [Anaerolineaceae bacterium]